jgi:hypothetical protein
VTVQNGRPETDTPANRCHSAVAAGTRGPTGTPQRLKRLSYHPWSTYADCHTGVT